VVVAETASHSWTCPACGRRVPLRAEACHCGTTRERARQLATAAPVAARPARPSRPGARARARAEAMAAMTGDVKVLLVAGALVMVAGLGWLVFGRSRPPSMPRVLGWVDQGAPPAPKPTPPPRPPFKLPWWK
jgi:hypothetical protein